MSSRLCVANVSNVEHYIMECSGVQDLVLVICSSAIDTPKKRQLTARDGNQQFSIPSILVLPQCPAIGNGEIIGVASSCSIPHMSEFGSFASMISSSRRDNRSLPVSHLSSTADEIGVGTGYLHVQLCLYHKPHSAYSLIKLPSLVSLTRRVVAPRFGIV